MTQLPTDFFTDPHPRFHRDRARAPVLWSEFANAWWVTGYHEVRTALREIDRFTVERPPDDPRGGMRTTLTTGPPLHAERHGRLAAALSARTIEGQTPDLDAIARRLIRGATAAGAVEAVEAVATPLAGAAFEWMLGLDATSFDQVQRWDRQANAIDDLTEEREAAVKRLRAVGVELLAAVRAANAGHLGDALHDWDVPDEELTGELTGIIGNAPANTVGMLTQLLHQLAVRPPLLASLRTTPALATPLIEETLRLEGPVNFVPRWAGRDTELGGEAIAEGQQLLVVVAAANRDAAAIPEPDEFDLARDHRAHVALGSGARYCVGAPLVRATARALLGAVAADVATIELAGEPAWQRRGVQFRYLDALPLRLTAAER